MIVVDRLTKTFRVAERRAGAWNTLAGLVRRRWRTVNAVNDLSFSLAEGELVGLIGPNGAGKSTTIKMLTGILYPSAGEARVLGLVPWADRRTLAYNIAAVFGQKSQLWYHLPPQATFDLLARVYELEPAAYRRRAGELIDLFDLGQHLRTPVRKLSLGERMRCELAAALLHRPQVLFLDEPTIGLDVIAKQRMRSLIRRLNADEGVTVFLTSHDAGDVEQVCRRVIVINHGSLILDEPVATLKREFLQTKVIDLKLAENAPAAADLPFSGVSVVDQGDWGVRLEVNTARQPIDAVIAHLVAHYRVADITIGDPPMEEIIAQIYQRSGQWPVASGRCTPQSADAVP